MVCSAASLPDSFLPVLLPCKSNPNVTIVQVKKDARIYLVGLRGSVWLWELLMLLIISRASEAKKVQLQAAQRKCFPE